MTLAEIVIVSSAAVLLIYFIVLALTWPDDEQPQKMTLKHLPKEAYHQSLGRAGDSLRYYKPKRNIHRIINRIVTGEVQAFQPGAVITQQKKFPDVSFYQGLISWIMMRDKTDAIIIRAGQNLWADAMFLVNYAAAKLFGMLRGIYWFYDDRVSPGDQAAKLIELIADDLPEMEIWIDWERSYGGGFKGLKNVVAMMEVIERAFPDARVGLYTGYWWFIENSNAILNWSQYQYLSKRPLWLAWYADASYVKIPAPWTKLTLWQFGTPAEDWGQASHEIDMNFFDGSISEFYARYKMTEPTDESEAIMATYTGRAKLTSTPNVRIRKTYPDGMTIGAIQPGQAFKGNRIEAGWMHVIEVGSSPIDGWSAAQYLEYTEVQPPTEPTDPPADLITGEMDVDINLTVNGVNYGATVMIGQVRLQKR